jgi:hypothetical protein
MDAKFEKVLALLKEILLDEDLADDEAEVLSSIHEDISAVYEMTMDRRLATLTPAQQATAEEQVPGAKEAMDDAYERVRNRLQSAGLLPKKDTVH